VGCASTINENAAQRANEILANADKGVAAPYPAVDSEQEARLWRDKPEYAALAARRPAKRVRVVSVAAPDYPVFLALSQVHATVKVSFIVGVDGNVEDVRIFESSDSRFDASALEAMRQFKFLPAEGADGQPERYMNVQPFNFARPKKSN
jgi:TonB family protein